MNNTKSTGKTMFQKLEYLNTLDSETGSSYLQVCGNGNVISVDKKGKNGEVKIGIPPEIAMQVLQGEDVRFLLLVIDGKKYDSIT
jgi:hypothetical protein